MYIANQSSWLTIEWLTSAVAVIIHLVPIPALTVIRTGSVEA